MSRGARTLLLVLALSWLKLGTPLTDTYAVLGRPFSWTCDVVTASQQGPVRWQLNGVTLQTDQNVIINNDGTLYIKSVLDSNLGRYTCIAYDSQTYIESTAWLYAAYINSTVDIAPRMLSVMLNDVVSLVCKFDARPAPVITWLKDNTSLNQTQRIKVIQMDSARIVLQLTNVTYLDKGSYYCTVMSLDLNQSYSSANVNLSVYGPPMITLGPKSKTVPIGYNISYPCGSISEPPGVVSWSFTNTTLSPDNVDAFGTLRLYNVDLVNSGTYQCTWTNSFGSTSSPVVSLTVAGKPMAPIIITRPSMVKLMEGELLNLVCTGDGNPKPSVLWIHPSGQGLAVGDFSFIGLNLSTFGDTIKNRASVNDSGTLSLQNITRYDAGSYTCVLANPEGSTNASAVVDVEYAPYFTQTPQSSTVKEGGTFTLQCSAVANPVAEITWSTPINTSRNISASDAIGNEVVLSSGSLQVNLSYRRHQGMYTCFASNKVGSARVSASISVLGPPAFLVIPVSQGVVEGDSVILQCQVDSNPPATVEWYYRYMVDPSIQSTDVAKIKEMLLSEGNMPNGNLTLVVPRLTPRYSLDNGTSLKIINVLESDAGLYVCMASNNEGMRFEPTILRVITFPKFEVMPKNQTVNLGSTVTLQCYSVGIPVPTQRWLFNNYSLQLNSRITKDANGTLTINNVQQSDIGMYTCHANNQAGSKNTSVYLRLTGLPYFTSPPINITVSEFSGVALPCRGNSSSPMFISWYTSDSSGSSLQFLAKIKYGETQTLWTDQQQWLIAPEGDLVFQCALRTDKSWFVCSLENQDGVTTSPPAYLSINYAPSDVMISTPSVYSSQSSTLNCSGSSSPVPVITWVTPLKTVINSTGVAGVIVREMLLGEMLQSSLTISNTNNFEYGGKWLCRACNILGCALRSASLDVSETPVIVREIYGRDLESEFSVSCITTGLPLPIIRYFFEETDVSTLDGHRLSNNVMYVTKTKIKSRYKCDPVNRYGSVPVTFEAPTRAIITNVFPDSTSARIILTFKATIPSMLPNQVVFQSRLRDTEDWKNTTYFISDNVEDYLTVGKIYSVVSNISCSNSSSLQITTTSAPLINVTVDSNGDAYVYTTSADVFDLKPLSQYDFRAFLVNILGSGAESSIFQSSTSAAAPSPVTNVTVDIINRTAFVKWKHPDPLNGEVRDTEISAMLYNSASTIVKHTIVDVVNPPEVSFPNLNYGDYFVELFAYNRQTNKRSNVTRIPFRVKDLLLDYAPSISGVRALDAFSVEVNWTSSSTPVDLLATLTGFVIRVSSADNQTESSMTYSVSYTNVSTWVVHKLDEHKQYSVRVAFMSSAGTGAYSDPANITTPYSPFSETPLEDTSLSATLNWKILVIVLVCIGVAVMAIVAAVVFTHQRKLGKRKSVDLQHGRGQRLDDSSEFREEQGSDIGQDGSKVEGYDNKGFTGH
ncbi:hemicentin-1-like [Biomphalaria glabrata]|uniref:Hemicentin-1-like n=1 Tax=Biomphalaria glabrata TaxID=6526 RepID=A0A9U8EKZ4_BIOGL|nr:hemicentin-1-like [Biomphalaria glabrata]XP_013091517.2 hemicentin-1-like [Biomphalaria glabrata]